MKKKLQQTIEIPEGVELNLEGTEVSVKGADGEVKREFDVLNLDFEKKDNNLVIRCDAATKREKKMMNTIAAHVKNMIKGVQKKFEYQVKICSSHFPMTVDIQKKEAVVKNFLGEKVPRKVRIPKGVELKKEGEIITINSVNKELAGQTAANFEAATKIRKRDRRIFQDGIFIINKDGREM